MKIYLHLKQQKSKKILEDTYILVFQSQIILSFIRNLMVEKNNNFKLNNGKFGKYKSKIYD